MVLPTLVVMIPSVIWLRTKGHELHLYDLGTSAESLADLLALAGHETAVAYDGEEAVEATARQRPDVILLNIGLPKLNGYDACRRIREHRWAKNVVIIALTGWGQADDRRKPAEAGFDAHLVKPVDHAALQKLLASLTPQVQGQPTDH